MKLKKVALITSNVQLARFFQIELLRLSYDLSIFRSLDELWEQYDCVFIDNDTALGVANGYLCPTVNISSHFSKVNTVDYELPWPTPIRAIMDVLRAIECEDTSENVDRSAVHRNHNTVYVTDSGANLIMIGNLRVKLTPSEFLLLDTLCSAKGELVPKEVISGLLGAKEGNIAEVYICRLRKKIEGPLGRKFIFSVRGKGYKTDLKIKK